MREELEKQLLEKYPTIMGAIHGSCSCGDGWYALIDQLCELIMKTPGYDTFTAVQVKEKFGGLRFYGGGGNGTISGYVSAAEDASYKTCEHCGATEGVTTGGKRWIRSLCPKCRPIYDGEPE